MLRPGQLLVCHYPSTTRVESKFTWHLRRFRIRAARDLVEHPLTIREYLRRPLVRRSRWLLTVTDIDRGTLRQVYLGNMREHWIDAPLRVGIYRGDRTTPAELLSKSFAPTVADRIQLAHILRTVPADMQSSVGIFSDDLSVIASIEKRA